MNALLVVEMILNIGELKQCITIKEILSAKNYFWIRSIVF